MNIQTTPTDEATLPDSVLHTFESLTALKRHNAIDESQQKQLTDLIKQYPELAHLMFVDDFVVSALDFEALPDVYAALQPDSQARREKGFMAKIHAIRLAEVTAERAAEGSQPFAAPPTVIESQHKPHRIYADSWITKIKAALGINGGNFSNSGWQLAPTFAMGALVGVIAVKVLSIDTNEPVMRSVITTQTSVDIRMAVDSNVSMATVQRTLLGLNAQIVAGPDSMGYITLRVARDDAAGVLAALKLQSWVTSVTDKK